MRKPPSPLAFFGKLKWLDGRPLLDTIEPYRQRIYMDALYTFEVDGRPRYSMALCGRGKKNWKTADLVLAGLYRLLAWPSPQGNDGFILANDEGQAADDLSLAKKLVEVNPGLKEEVSPSAKAIARKDGRGALQVLPARDAIGAHGKTALFLGFDEIHGYRNHDLFEALAPDPTRHDVMTWITSYAGIRHAPGIPLYDFLKTARAGTDPKMYFSWYGGDFSSDPDFADKPPEERANPSMASWDSPGYLAQQRRRLPTHKFRRLHLNLPGAPDGAALSADHVMAAIVTGRRSLPREDGRRYYAFVDMSGGSSDDAYLGIGYFDDAQKRAVLAMLDCQNGRPPFSPRAAVKKFAGILQTYGIAEVVGDNYAGQTFKDDFAEHGIKYVGTSTAKSTIYELLEPRLNAGEVELLDHGVMQEQLLTLVYRGGSIDHQKGDHDDAANAAAGAIWRVFQSIKITVPIVKPIVVRSQSHFQSYATIEARP